MKLLSKPAINSAKALERSLEISEGKKLAEKVDQLRELKAQEERNLIKFRDEMKKKILGEIDVLINKKSALQTEVAWLQDVKAEAKKPVDKKEKQFAEREAVLNERDADLVQRKVELVEEKRQLKLAREALERDIAALEPEKKETKRLLKEAQQVEKDARAKAREADALYQSATERSNQIAEALLKRETNIAAKERDLKNRSQHLDRVQDQLNVRERAIIDREETQGRELKRIIQ